MMVFTLMWIVCFSLVIIQQVAFGGRKGVCHFCVLGIATSVIR